MKHPSTRNGKAFANEPSAPETEDQKKMGGTLNWFSYEADKPTPFPTPEEIPWAIQCSEEYNIPIKQYEWTWETGFEIDNALDLFMDLIVIREATEKEIELYEEYRKARSIYMDYKYK